MIRPATPGDAPVCARIYNDWVDQTAWMPRIHTRESVERHYCGTVLAKRRVLIAESEGTPAGFLALDDAEVTDLYLDGSARGRGLGADLLGALGGGPLHLWTFAANEGARRFYAREGFTEVRRTDGDNEESLPDVLMERCG